jgi:hypothetical protein
MASSLHVHGVKIPCHGAIRSSKLCPQHMPIALKRLRFSDSVASHSRLLCAAIEDSSRSGRRRAMIKGGVEAVFREEEIEERFPDGTAEAFTCVMKFGGSSVASAKRMREITDLIRVGWSWASLTPKASSRGEAFPHTYKLTTSPFHNRCGTTPTISPLHIGPWVGAATTRFSRGLLG